MLSDMLHSALRAVAGHSVRSLEGPGERYLRALNRLSNSPVHLSYWSSGRGVQAMLFRGSFASALGLSNSPKSRLKGPGSETLALRLVFAPDVSASSWMTLASRMAI